jgi:hypothetical protein
VSREYIDSVKTAFDLASNNHDSISEERDTVLSDVNQWFHRKGKQENDDENNNSSDSDDDRDGPDPVVNELRYTEGALDAHYNDTVDAVERTKAGRVMILQTHKRIVGNIQEKFRREFKKLVGERQLLAFQVEERDERVSTLEKLLEQEEAEKRQLTVKFEDAKKAILEKAQVRIQRKIILFKGKESILKK